MTESLPLLRALVRRWYIRGFIHGWLSAFVGSLIAVWIWSRL